MLSVNSTPRLSLKQCFNLKESQIFTRVCKSFSGPQELKQPKFKEHLGQTEQTEGEIAKKLFTSSLQKILYHNISGCDVSMFSLSVTLAVKSGRIGTGAGLGGGEQRWSEWRLNSAVRTMCGTWPADTLLNAFFRPSWGG